MAWRIDFTRNADKAMRKLDKGVAARVFDELDEIAKLEDPRSRGKALTGNLSGVWRYRVGDYRILCDINDGRLVILVFGHPHLDACFFSPHVAFGTSRFSRIIRLQIAPPRLQTVRNRAAGLPPTENRQL